MNSNTPQDVSSELFALIKQSNSQTPEDDSKNNNTSPNSNNDNNNNNNSNNTPTSLSSIQYPTMPSQSYSSSSSYDNTAQDNSHHQSKTPPPGILPSMQQPPPPPQAERSASYPTSPNTSTQVPSYPSPFTLQQHPQDTSQNLPPSQQQPQDLSRILNSGTTDQTPQTATPPDTQPLSAAHAAANPVPDTVSPPVEIRNHQMRLEGNNVTFEPRLKEAIHLENCVEISSAEPQPVAPGHRLITSNKDYLACVLRSRMIRVFHKYSSQRGVLKRHEYPITEIRFMSRESNVAASVSQDGALIVWEVSSGESQFGFNILYRFKADSQVVRMAWNPQRSLQLIFACANGSLIMCDLTSIVNQEDTAPIMEYLIEENPEDFITTIDFSWDGRRFATASTQGMLMLWDAEEFKVIKEWIPHSYAPVSNVRILGSHVATQYTNFLVTAAQDNRELKVWDMEGMCLQTLNIRSGFPLDIFEQETSSRHILLASSMSTYMCVLRLNISEDGSQCRFDLVSELDAGYHVLSMSAISQLKENMVHIGVFSMLKNKGICLLHIEGSQISWSDKGEADTKTTTTTPTASTSATSPGPAPKTTDVDNSPRVALEQESQRQQLQNSPRQEASTSPSLEKTPKKVPSPVQDKREDEIEETSPRVNTSNQTESTELIMEDLTKEDLQNMIEQSVSKVMDQQEQAREREAKERRKLERQRQKDLLKEISRTLSEDVPDTIEHTVENCFETSVMPSLSSAVESKLSSSIQQLMDSHIKPVVPKLERTLQENLKSTLSKELSNNMPQNMEQIIHQAVQQHLRSNFQELVIPSFEEICRRMFSQINDAFQRGLQDHVANLTTNNNNNNTDAILEQLRNISQQLNRLEDAQGRNARPSTSTETRPTRSRLQETDIQRMIAAKDFDTLLFEVLSTSNLNLLLNVCSRLDPGQVINSNLSNVTLLSLVQQLGFDLTSHTSMKVAWLKKALLKLSSMHDDFITQKSPAILNQVRQNATKAMQHVEAQDMEELQLLTHVLNGLVHHK